MKAEFYVGSYASECEEGILKVRADFERGRFTRTGGFTGIPNPSWVLARPDGKMLYAVQEKNPDGRLSAFSVSGNILTLLHTWETDGADPCHISLDPQGTFLSVANYTSGSLAVFRLDAQGVPEGMGGFVQHAGTGTDPVRQEGPHIHFSMMHEGELFVTDLGLDRISRYRVDRRSGKLQEGRTAGHRGGRIRSAALLFSPAETTAALCTDGNGKHALCLCKTGGRQFCGDPADPHAAGRFRRIQYGCGHTLFGRRADAVHFQPGT
jgi:6-phosphogluconolactonase (cycloisomerase 2 family)